MLSNKSALEQDAVALAEALFAQAKTDPSNIAIIVIVTLTVLTVVTVVVIVIGYLACRHKR